MTENSLPITVVVEENTIRKNPDLVASVLEGDMVINWATFSRNASPEEIADRLMDAGMELKYREGDIISGDFLINAAYEVPGLDQGYFDEDVIDFDF